MLLTAEKWYAAIAKRHTVRNFNDELPDQRTMAQLRQLAEGLSGESARALIATEGFELIMPEVKGSYGSVPESPFFAAVIGNTKSPMCQEMCGYLGQTLVLEAAAEGLGSLWIGGFFPAEAVTPISDLAPEERLMAVIDLGFEALDHRFQELEASRAQRPRSRRRLDELVTGLPRESWAAWMEPALEAARLAPSVFNRQPWRFRVEENAIVVALDNPADSYQTSKRLDCGIAMLHLELGANHAGADGHWRYLPTPDVAVFTKD